MQFILLLPLLTTIIVAVHSQQSTENCARPVTSTARSSALLPVVERVFSRKKRFLIFPPKSSLKFTCNLSKRLLAQYPSGFNFNIEAALYYPVFGSRIDLIPKRLRPKTTTTPKPTGSTTPLIVYIPGSLIRYKAKPATKPPKVQRIDDLGNAVQWIDSKHSEFAANKQPPKWLSQSWSQQQAAAPPPPAYNKWATRWPQQQQKWQQKLQHKQQQWTQAAWNKWTTPMPWPVKSKWQGNWSRRNHSYGNWASDGQQRWQRALWATRQNDEDLHMDMDELVEGKTYKMKRAVEKEQFEASEMRQSDFAATLKGDDEFEQHLNEGGERREKSMKSEDSWVIDDEQEVDGYDPEPSYMHFPELEPYYEWRHFHSHRDRRQLYKQFEGLSGILGIDLKSCIMRAMCDTKRFLMPPGYSLVHDLLRLVFNFPTISGMTDEYSRIVQADYETCDKQLRKACPFNMLNWLMGHKSV